MPAQTIILRGDSQRYYAKDLIDVAQRDAVVTIKEPTRSLLQSAKMWAMLADVSKAQPEGRQLQPETWKALFMHACGHEVRFEAGLDGGEPFPVGFHSSRLTVPQMALLITSIYEYGDRHGVRWSDERNGHGA